MSLLKCSVRLNRRAMLACSAAVSLGGLRAAESSDEQAAPTPVPRIDTHLHCFAGPDDDRFPYHPDAPYRPEEAATPQHLLQCLDGAGVAAAVVVHPEPYQDDHRYLEYCLRVGGGRLKGTTLLFADRPDTPQRLAALVSRLPIIATRIHAYAPERLPPFGSRELRELWHAAAENGIAVQLHFEPRYAAEFEPLIREFHQTPVIIDHLGRPFQGTPQEHAVVVRWAELPNTWIKLSSIPAATAYPHRDIAPVVDELAAAYGAERMLYGGGFNAAATAESYRAAFERAAGFLDRFSEADRAKVLGGNADRLFFDSRAAQIAEAAAEKD